jgi:hypothetical protein
VLVAALIVGLLCLAGYGGRAIKRIRFVANTVAILVWLGAVLRPDREEFAISA